VTAHTDGPHPFGRKEEKKKQVNDLPKKGNGAWKKRLCREFGEKDWGLIIQNRQGKKRESLGKTKRGCQPTGKRRVPKALGGERLQKMSSKKTDWKQVWGKLCGNGRSLREKRNHLTIK